MPPAHGSGTTWTVGPSGYQWTPTVWRVMGWQMLGVAGVKGFCFFDFLKRPGEKAVSKYLLGVIL